MGGSPISSTGLHSAEEYVRGSVLTRKAIDQRWDVSKLTHPSQRKRQMRRLPMIYNDLAPTPQVSDQSCDVFKLSTHAAQTVLLADFR